MISQEVAASGGRMVSVFQPIFDINQNIVMKPVASRKKEVNSSDQVRVLGRRLQINRVDKNAVIGGTVRMKRI